MAQKVVVHLEDDLEGGPATETVTFTLDGKNYAIDLSTDNAEKLREILRPFAVAGRKSTGTRGTRTHTSGSDPDTAKIRAWAKENGHDVSDRGRIHQHIRDAYYATR